MSKSRALSKQDCIALRDQLTELGYGQAEAETDELFALRLYPVTEHLALSIPRSFCSARAVPGRALSSTRFTERARDAFSAHYYAEPDETPDELWTLNATIRP